MPVVDCGMLLRDHRWTVDSLFSTPGHPSPAATICERSKKNTAKGRRLSLCSRCLYAVVRLALRELEAAARLAAAVFFAFDFAGVAAHEAGIAQRRLELRVGFDQRPRDRSEEHTSELQSHSFIS